jgi:2-oxoisovalerate dehydrogenase E1 component alpha subunit
VPDPSEAVLFELYRTMLLARTLDERMAQLNRAGRAPFAPSCRGHEAAQVGAAFALRRGEDFLLLAPRGLGVALAIGMTPREIMLGMLARAADPSSGGRQMPGHYSHRVLRIVTPSGAAGDRVAHAAGIALAEKLRGGGAVAWVSFGASAARHPDVLDAVALAAAQGLPVVLQCERRVAASSALAPTQEEIATAINGLYRVAIDGGDALAAYAATFAATARARAGSGPTLIDASCPTPTQARSDRESWRARDPLARFHDTLVARGALDATMDGELRAAVGRDVDDAIRFAEHAPPPDPGTLGRHVYAG